MQPNGGRRGSAAFPGMRQNRAGKDMGRTRRPFVRFCLQLTLAALLLSMIGPSALASAMDDHLDLGMISVKTQALNPLTAEEREFQSLTALVYEGLFALDDNYRWTYCIAKYCVISESGKDWTITLRDDVTFHDGRPCTAYDVVATIQEILRLADEGKGQYNQLKYIIAGAKANSADQLVITANRPYYGVYYALTFPILPRDQVQDPMPLGTGPYKVFSFSPANSLMLSANETWWNGAPSVKDINVRFFATNRELITSYESNMVDAIITRSASAGQYQSGVTNLNISYRTRQLETLLLNNSSSAFPLDNPKVREAIRCAIDFDAIAYQVYMGTVQRTNTPMPSGTWMYRDNDTAFAFNPDKARQLLDEAGWTADPNRDNGVRHTTITEKGEPKDRRLRLRLYVYEEQTNSVRLQVANMISEYLADVGIEAAVESYTFPTVAARLNARNFDMAIAAFQMDVTPDPGFLLMTGNTGNYVGYKSTEMDNLFKKLRAQHYSDDQQYYEDYRNTLMEIQDLFIADCPFICMWYRSGALLTRKVFTVVRDVREPEILRGIEAN